MAVVDATVRPLLLVLDDMPLESRAQVDAVFSSDFEVVFIEGGASERLNAVRSATVLLAGWGAVDAATIDAADRCRVIQKLGVGTDKIDVVAAERRRIPVLRAAGINAAAVAEMTILLTLAVLRRLVWAAETVRGGILAKEELRITCHQLAGRTVGLVGMGYVGRAAAQRFAAFDAHLMYHDVRRLPGEVERDLGLTYVPLDDLMHAADVVSLHAPLTDATRGMIDAARLARMQPSAILINTARGGLVDEPALVDALARGALGGAGLDVTAREPISPESPLLAMTNVLVTPHYAAAVADNFPRVLQHAFENVRTVLAGRDVPSEDIVRSTPDA